MDKAVAVRGNEITFSIWDLGGQKEFLNMLPLVCNESLAILFMFDLTRSATLMSVKEWYRQARGINKVHWMLLPRSLPFFPFFVLTSPPWLDGPSHSCGYEI